MMINSKTRNALILFVMYFMFSSCKKAWQNHDEVLNQELNKTLIEQVNETPNLSIFNTYLVKTGYDKILASSKSYTVWAPTNEAMQNLDPAIIADTAKLKLFVANHISYQQYFTTTPNPTSIIRTLSGKNITFTATAFEEAKIVTANVYVKNGVLHTIDQAAGIKPNAYEYMLSTTLSNKQKTYIQSLFHTEIDTSKGVRLYTDPATKKTVYQAGTTFPVTKNYYFQKVSDISNEDSLLTYIILNDAAYEAEKVKIRKYYNVSSSATKTDSLAQFNIVKDLVVNHIYSADNLPDSLTTVSGVKIHLDKSAILQTQKLSNGIAYVVNSISYKVLENKIPTIYIQGEFPDSLRTPSSPLIKIKKDPNGIRYTDIQSQSITSSPDPLYYYKYKTVVNSAQYRVYWRAVNDIFTTPFSQKLDFSSTSYYPKAIEPPLTTLGYKSVAVNTFSEVYLGIYTPANYGNLYTFLVSALGVVSTTPSALSLDYIKLVPVN
jgi:hypothetical protein